MTTEPRHREHGLWPDFADPVEMPPHTPQDDRFVWVVSAVLIGSVLLALGLAAL